MTIAESLVIDYEEMTAFTKSGANLKGVRKVIQDRVKKETGIKGYWTVWFEGEVRGCYQFKLDNPYWRLISH